MFSQQLVHLEHVSTICFEYQFQLIIANYLPLVTRILEIVFPYVSPQLLHNLRHGVDIKPTCQQEFTFFICIRIQNKLNKK